MECKLHWTSPGGFIQQKKRFTVMKWMLYEMDAYITCFDSIEFSIKNCLTDIGPCINGVRIALDKSWWVLGFYR